MTKAETFMAAHNQRKNTASIKASQLCRAVAAEDYTIALHLALDLSLHLRDLERDAMWLADHSDWPMTTASAKPTVTQ